MDFARINPRRDAETAAPYHVSYLGEELYRDAEQKQPIRIFLYGMESELGRQETAKLAKRLDALQKRKGVTKGKRQRKGDQGGLANMSVDEIVEVTEQSEKYKAMFYAAMTSHWENVTYIDDDDPDAEPYDLEHNFENAVMLYTTRGWILEDMEDFLGDPLSHGNVGESD